MEEYEWLLLQHENDCIKKLVELGDVVDVDGHSQWSFHARVFAWTEHLLESKALLLIKSHLLYIVSVDYFDYARYKHAQWPQTQEYIVDSGDLLELKGLSIAHKDTQGSDCHKVDDPRNTNGL